MNSSYSNMLNHLLNGESLTEAEAYDLMLAMADESISPILSGALLTGLRAKASLPKKYVVLLKECVRYR